MKKIIKRTINNISDNSGFINLKLKYPNKKKKILTKKIIKFVLNRDLFFLNKI